MCDRDIRIAHNSYLSTCSPIQAWQDVINLVTEAGLIVVGSAGNGTTGGNCGNPSSLVYPSAYDNVISVSSVSSSLCCETTYNPWGAPYNPPLHHNFNNTVDVLAQGYSVVTGNCSGGGQSLAFGTSISGPHVAGIVGLMLSVNPCLNHDEVLEILQTTGQDVTNVCNNSTYYPNGAPPLPCAEAAVTAAENYIGPDIIIDVDTEWDKKYVSGNVIIKGGATLTVVGKVSFNTNSKIIVEKNAGLVLDEGILTACNEDWLGVVVEGDAVSGNQLSAGRVYMTNNSVIEYARTAVSMNPTHLGWPQVQDGYGGLIEAENSSFINCNRAVEFMKFGTGFIEDQSYFDNCTFERISTRGVTIWANNNVTFTNCLFKEIELSGIYAYDSEVIVEDRCRFFDQHTGVDILTTYPIPFGSQIGKEHLRQNVFSCEDNGVFVQSAGNIRALRINNNRISGGASGVYVNGISNYIIENNSLLSSVSGVECISTGSDAEYNLVKNNIFSEMEIGSNVIFNNSSLEYIDNCFRNSSTADIVVNTGNIFVEQGNNMKASGNCFTKNQIPELVNSQNDLIKLFIWQNEPTTSCKYPTEIISNPLLYNVVIDFSTNPSDGSLCTGTIMDPEWPETPRDPRDNFLIDLEGQEIKESEMVEEAITFFSSHEFFGDKIYALELMMNTHQLDRARDYLNSLSLEGIEQENFVFSQNLNIDFLENRETYNLDISDRTKLYNIAKGAHPLDGYSRSIYEVITGDRVILETPDFEFNIGERTNSKQELTKENRFLIFPNPTSKGLLNISMTEHLSESRKVNIRIDNLNGVTIFDKHISTENYIINTSTFDNGLYLISIYNDDNLLMHLEKLVIVN